MGMSSGGGGGGGLGVSATIEQPETAVRKESIAYFGWILRVRRAATDSCRSVIKNTNMQRKVGLHLGSRMHDITQVSKRFLMFEPLLP